MKKKIIVPVLALFAVCLAVFWLYCGKKESTFREYTLLLPQGMTFEADRKDQQNGDILRDEKIVGGIISIFRDWKNGGQADNYFQPLFPQYELTSHMILDALEEVGAPGNRESFDCMLESSLSADCEVWYGNREEEYKHYIYVFEDGLIDLWFDRRLVDAEEANKIASDFSVDR